MSLSDTDSPKYRLTVDRGLWHVVSKVSLSVMVMAVPRRRNAGYALLASPHDGSDWTVVRVDWETLVVWGLADTVLPPAAVTPIHSNAAHGEAT